MNEADKPGAKSPLLPRLFLGLCVVGLGVALVSGLLGRTAPIGLGVNLALVSLALAAASSTRFRGSAFTIWVFAAVALALFYPSLLTSWAGEDPKKIIGPRVFVPLIQVIMFGMGMTLTLEDFARVFKMPKAVLIGVTLQFTVMPVMGLTFGKLFGLEPEVAVGLILIGSCPGGVASNVIVYIARANVALSVTMTACSTLLSPLLTPLAMKLIAGTIVPIAFGPMMVSILKLILVPVIVGLLVNRYVHKFARQLLRVLPTISMLGICIIIALTIALARDKLLVVGLSLFAAAACHNAAGLVLGYGTARALGLNKRDSRTVAIEVGIQNGGMASTLALNTMKSEVIALASAVFGPWSAVATSALASYWRRRDG
ncbi:MAG: bile acid:sodium symporter family protein [Planctomycetota bacterium]|nr:bile acid:sodium symporter family protein [Planctomycetota bacterium]